MGNKKLGGPRAEDEVTFWVRLRLKKSEKILLERAARLRKGDSHDGKPPVAAVVVSSLRFAWRTIDQASGEEEHEALSEQEAIQSGLTPHR